MSRRRSRIVVRLSPAVVAELQYLIRLCRDDPCSCAPGTLEDLVTHVMVAVANGSRRPGAWERAVISMLGLVSSNPEHQIYRSAYGDPAKATSSNPGQESTPLA